MKDGDREYKKKIKPTGGGPPPSRPKATEEFTLAASMMEFDLAVGDNVYDSFGQAPVNDRNGAHCPPARRYVWCGVAFNTKCVWPS